LVRHLSYPHFKSLTLGSYPAAGASRVCDHIFSLTQVAYDWRPPRDQGMLTFIADRKQDRFGDLSGSPVYALRGFTQE
jgi:hypothetical protein